ncbi:MAG: energy transducer TonB [Opitutae bacterium]|nr:energy transducer TonB [Opitutae bacterium]
MEAHMNIQKYLLPATLAATVHVALLWFLPAGARPQEGDSVIAVPILPPIPKVTDEVVKAPEEREETTVPVTRISGGPSRPEIPEPLMPPKPEDMTIPRTDTAINPWKDLNKISPKGGPGNSGDIGIGDWNGRTIIGVGALDSTPRAKAQLPPDYPYAMKQAGVGGSVWVEFDVNAEGRVIRAEAVRCTHREFSEPAVRAVMKWRFEPGRRNGRPVPFRLTVPIEFGLAND